MSEDSDGTRSMNPEYDVGYGKPPKRTRFCKGQTGNPRGRKPPQRVEDLGALLDEILAEEVTVLEGKRKRKMTNLEAMFHAQRMNALKSNQLAILTLFKIANTTGMLSPRGKRRSNIEIFEREGDQARILWMYHKEQAELKKKAFGIDPQSDKNDE